MRKRTYMAVLLLTAGLLSMTLGAGAQQSVCPGQVPLVTGTGEFNSTTLAGGSRIADTGTKNWKTGTQMPLYTKRDTVTDAGTSTYSEKISTECNSVYSWVHVTGISGTNTSCTVKLQVSGDAAKGTDWLTVQTFTVSATNPVGYVLVNSGNKWPYTNFRWVFTGSGTQVSSWYGGMMAR